MIVDKSILRFRAGRTAVAEGLAIAGSGARLLIAAGLIAAVATSSAIAYDLPKLPKSAKPMPAADIVKAYSGKTITWHDAKMYWGVDNKVIGITIKGNAITVGAASWEASDGQICYHATWLGFKPSDTLYPLSNCFHYAIDGKKMYHNFTSDKSKSDTGWWKGGGDIPGALVSGNTIQSSYDAVLAKIPANKLPKS